MSHSMMASINEDLKKIPFENKLTTPRHFLNFHSERNNKLNFTYLLLKFTSARIESSVRQKLDAKVVKTELKNSF